MSTALVHLTSRPHSPAYSRYDDLRGAVLNGVTAENSKRNYAQALDELSIFSSDRPVSKA